MLSFFDEPEQPRAERSRPARRRPAMGPGTDRQTLMVRRSLAAGAGLLVLILLVIGVRGCLNARNERAIKDYVRDVNALIGESNQQSKLLFNLLGNSGSTDDVDIQNKLNELRVTSDQLRRPRRRHLDPGRHEGGPELPARRRWSSAATA